MLIPRPLQRILTLANVDFPADRKLPSTTLALVASAIAILGSLVADALIARVAISLMPASMNYPHFQFVDYAKLTVIGVIIACVAWPINCAITSKPKWLFSRLAVLVTLVLLLPDLWIFLQGQPAKYVTALVLMHVAIAIVTYLSLTLIAPSNESESVILPRYESGNY